MASVDWIGYCLSSIAVVVVPGPGSVFVAKTAATSQGHDSAMAMLGIMAGDLCLILISMLGVSTVFLAYPSLFQGIKLAGAGYLIFLGLQSLVRTATIENCSVQAKLQPFRQAVSITLCNPKAVFFFMAFFPVFIRSEEDGLFVAYAFMTLVFMAISAAYLSVLMHASSRLATAFQHNPMVLSIARKLCGCVFIGFGLKVALLSN